MLNKSVLGVIFFLVAHITLAADHKGQVRGLYVGMPVSELAGNKKYFFSCTHDGKLVKINDYNNCQKGNQGAFQINVAYNDNFSEWGEVNDKWKGTKLAGHPVSINLSINNEGNIERIDVKTDPNARMYMKKKSFLLGDRIKTQFGENNWSCLNGEKNNKVEAAGGVMLDELCRKDFQGFRIVTHVQLFYRLEDGEKQYINSTKFSILATS